MKFNSSLLIFISFLLLTSSATFASVDLADDPLFLNTGAGANVLLNMSVETPMGGGAYNDAAGSIPGCNDRISFDFNGDGNNTAHSETRIGRCYFPSFEYIGYFDAKKCYSYGSSRFTPADNTNADHSCTGKSAAWSGNFLNWANMTAIDTYMLTMTGGRRITDTTSQTVIERSLAFVAGYAYHTKAIGTAIDNSSGSGVDLSTVTPYSDSWGRITQNQNSTEFRIDRSGGGNDTFNVAVEVCKEDSSLANNGLEANCVARTDGTDNYYKPEGLIQNNSKKLRFGVMAYTTDNSHTRHGGVLRSNMKAVGPELGTGEDNTLKEYNDDGLFITNPTGASSGNSGVINYVNKFAVLAGQYKSFDPVSELFYEAIRFFKNDGPTPENYTGLSTNDNGGFAILTDSDWQDPIQYECQSNFMVAINDAFPWNDKRLPGTHFNSSPVTDALGRSISFSRDGGEPSNADTDINVTTLTNTVGSLEDTESGGEIQAKLGTTKLGEILAPARGNALTPTNGDGRGNSYYLAGLGFYGNTQDLRPEANMPGEQTVSTFMIDSQEYNANPIIGNVNPLWLAGKYGGFVDANNDDIPQLSEWDADGDGAPDNYVLATEPQRMVEKLQESFNAITQITEASGSAVSINSTVLNTNSRIYQAVFSSADWSGDLNALSLNPDGTVNTQVWNASSRLPAHDLRNIFTTVDVSGIPTAKEFTAANVILGGSGSETNTIITPFTTGTASQISTYTIVGDADAANAFDQNTDGNYFTGNSVTHTNGDTDTDWWQLDLGSVQNINHLDIYNRTDCCQFRLSNLLVMVADTPFTSDTLTDSLANSDYTTQITGEALRINAGASSDYTDSTGREWLADGPYRDRGNNRVNNDNISNTNSGAFLGDTTDEVIYQTERRANNAVRFNIPITDTSIDYYVILHFSDSGLGNPLIVDVEFDQDPNLELAGFNVGASGEDTAVVKVLKYGDDEPVESVFELDINEVTGGNPRINAIEIIPEIDENLVTTNVGAAGRYIRIQKPGSDFVFNPGKEDRWLSLAEVEPHVATTVVTGGAANAEIVNYIRGDQTNEESQTTGTGLLRDRSSIIGDLVNSTPVTSSIENFFYDVLPGVEGSSYNTFIADKIAYYRAANGEFINVVYVGSNAGMLHAFQDTHDTGASATAGEEVFAYVPSQIHANLENLTRPDYVHENFVNAPANISDAYINSTWKTMLTGAFGSGAKGIYALDITDPLNFNASDVMWEFNTNSDVANGSDEMGFVLTSPQVVRLNDGSWGLIVGNGYNSTSQQARLFILNAADGSILKVLNTGVGDVANPNGLSEPILLDTDLDGDVDTAYAGDLHGKMWKFDLSGNTTASWGIAYDSAGDGTGTPIPLFEARDASNNPQPITSKPNVAFNTFTNSFNVIFGTGQFIEIGDNVIPNNPNVNSIYSVNDNGAAITNGRSSLVEQQILAEQDSFDDQGTTDTSDDVLTNRVRITSQHTVSYITSNGWYMDLLSPDGPDVGTDPDPIGERVIAQPLSRFSRGIFTTYAPSANPCDGGGTSLLMDLDALSGARLGESVYDVNQDSFIDANDLVLYNGAYTVASGVFINSTTSAPAVISASSGTFEYRIISNNSGGTQTIKASVDPTAVGRQSWRQIQ